jgi:hypothetical protein
MTTEFLVDSETASVSVADPDDTIFIFRNLTVLQAVINDSPGPAIDGANQTSRRSRGKSDG